MYSDKRQTENKISVQSHISRDVTDDDDDDDARLVVVVLWFKTFQHCIVIDVHHEICRCFDYISLHV